MRSFSILAAAAAALISTVGIAAEPATQSFTRDGRTYEYTMVARANGTTLIEGREAGSRARFRLLVNGNRVTGSSNGVPVSFRTTAPVATAFTAN